MSFDRIPRPIQRVVRQTNGPLVIVQDARNFYWILNRRNGTTVSERFELLEVAKEEAATLAFLHRPEAPSPKWTVPVDGRAAQDRFDRWAGR